MSSNTINIKELKGLKEQDVEPISKFIEALENGRKAQLITYGTVIGTGCRVLIELKTAIFNLRNFLNYRDVSYSQVYKETLAALNKVLEILLSKENIEHHEFLDCFIDENIVFDFTIFFKKLIKQITNTKYIETETSRRHYMVVSEILTRLIKAQTAISNENMERYLASARGFFEYGLMYE